MILSDRKFDIIERGISQIKRSFDRQIKAGKLTNTGAEEALGRIETAVSLEVGCADSADCRPCDCFFCMDLQRRLWDHSKLLETYFNFRRLQPFRKAEFVIEAAPEDEEIKKTIFRKLDQVSSLGVGCIKGLPGQYEKGVHSTSYGTLVLAGHTYLDHPCFKHKRHLYHKTGRCHKQATQV